MPFTNEDYLPTYEELSVQEVPLTSAPLRAGAHHFGKYCDNQCKEFMLCESEEKDPRKCIKEGKEVTKCALEFFNKVKEHCASEFTQYWKCIDKSGYDMALKNCRKPQGHFDKCIFDYLGQERPELGYFSKVRVHHTERPKPVRKLELPDADPMYSEFDPSKPEPLSAKQGFRNL